MTEVVDVAEEKAPVVPGEPWWDIKEDPISYRFEESGGQWVRTAAGHYRVLRCGDLVPTARVQLTIPGLEHRRGTVAGLLPGMGPSGSRPVIVVVDLDVTWSPPKNAQATLKKPRRHYQPSDLMVIGG